MFPLLAMNVAHADIPTRLFECFAQQPGVSETILHDASKAFEAEVDQVVVLGDDLSAGTGEVERVGFFGAAEVVELEDEVFGEIGLVAPNDPADAGIDEAEFVAGGVD